MIEDKLADSLIIISNLNFPPKPESEKEFAVNTDMADLSGDLHIPEGIEELIEETIKKDAAWVKAAAEEKKDKKYIKNVENTGMSDPEQRKSQAIFTEKIKFKKIIENYEFTDRSHRLMATLESLSAINQANIFRK